MSLYPALGLLTYRLVKPAFRLYPRTLRVRCLVMREGRILLVKNWLGRGQWTLPGGGVQRAETGPEAAVRELREELGIHFAASAVISLGVWDQIVDGMECRLDLCTIEPIDSKTCRNRRELIACEWFRLDSLPLERTAVVDEALRRYLQT